MPTVNEAYLLSDELIHAFRENGHILTRNVLSQEEVDVYRKVILTSAQRFNTETRKLEERDTYGKAFLQIKNLWVVDEAVRKFVMAKRFGRMAADLLGVKNVRIYHDQALFKEPKGGPTPWHQDQYYWPLDTSNMVTMWMPLVDVSTEMGMIAFASTSHKKGLLFNVEISDESEAEYREYVGKSNFPISRAASMKAGDATWHYGLTVHSAHGNNSETMREVMTIIYMAGDARVAAPKNSWQEEDRRVWLKSLSPGSLADSDINPLVL